jgi:hypothetical protein
VCPPHLEFSRDTIGSTMANMCSAGRVVSIYTLSFPQGPYVDTFALLRLHAVLLYQSPEQRQPSLVWSLSFEMKSTLVAIQAKPRLCSTPLWYTEPFDPVRQSKGVSYSPSVPNARKRLPFVSLHKSTPRTDSCDRAEDEHQRGPLEANSFSVWWILELRLCLG